MIRTYGLTHLALAVRDIDRASRFYNEVFGAVEVYRQDGFVQMQTPGTRDVLVFEQRTTNAGKSGGIRTSAFGCRIRKTSARGQRGEESGRDDQGAGRIRPRRAVSVRDGSGGYEIEILVRAADPRRPAER